MIVLLPEAFDSGQLLDEFAAAGLTLVSAERTGPREFEATFDEPYDPALVDQIVAAHQPETNTQMDALEAKALRVWRGEDTFTQAQTQKILAGLVLIENRKRTTGGAL